MATSLSAAGCQVNTITPHLKHGSAANESCGGRHLVTEIVTVTGRLLLVASHPIGLRSCLEPWGQVRFTPIMSV